MRVEVRDGTVFFSGSLEVDIKPSSNLGIILVDVDLEASYTPKSTDKSSPNPASYSITLSVDIDIPAPKTVRAGEEAAPDTTISCSISLFSEAKQKLFRLAGSLNNLYLEQLTGFFPADERGIIEDLLGHLAIKNFQIEYIYGSNGLASSFAVSATIILGPLELALSFNRNPDSWDFKATLQASEGVTAKIGDVMSHLLGDDGDDIVKSMPGFLTEIDLA